MARVQGRRGNTRRTTERSPLRTGAKSTKRLTGAPLLGRGITAKPVKTWPDPPKSWVWSLEEWIVYWYLRYEKGWVEKKDFYHDSLLYGIMLYRSGDTQADFVINLGPDSQAGMLGHYKAIVLDPFTEFTHDRETDQKRRNVLDESGYLLVFMASDDIKTRTKWVVEEALLGHDHSNRGAGQ